MVDIKQIGKLLKDDVGAKTGVEAPVRAFISTGSAALDWAISGRLLGGGVPIGRVVEFFGDPSTGKSLLIMHVLANTQQKNGIVVYDDAEQAYDQFFAERIGIIADELFMLDSETVEEHFKKVEKAVDGLRKADKSVLITIALDSLAMLSTEHEKAVGFEKVDMFKAKLIRQGMRVLGGRFSKENVLYIVANHTIANITKYGPPKTTPGGGGIPFQSSVRVELAKGGLLENKKRKGDIIGVHVKAYVVKNKVSPPFKKVEFDVYFDKGVDKYSGMFDVLVSMGIFEEAGGWYNYYGKKYRRNELESNIEEIIKKFLNTGVSGDGIGG